MSDISKVQYVVYPLNEYMDFFKNAGAVHAGLRVHLTNGQYREFHYALDSGWKNVSVYENTGPNSLGSSSTYHISDGINISYAKVKEMLTNEFQNSNYHLGKNDCWSLVEYFCKEIGVDVAKLGGPIGDRNGAANGVRHILKQADKALAGLKDEGAKFENKTRQEADNAAKSIAKVFGW